MDWESHGHPSARIIPRKDKDTSLCHGGKPKMTASAIFRWSQPQKPTRNACSSMVWVQKRLYCFLCSNQSCFTMTLTVSAAILFMGLLPKISAAPPGGPDGGGSQSQHGSYRKTDYGALIIDNTNFRESIQRFKFLVVLFYAPWCPHSQNFLRHYRRITKTLKKNNANVVIAEVDGSSDTGNPLIASENIEFYPTVMLFRNGLRMKYDGDKTDVRVLRWIQELSIPKMKRLNTLKEAADLLAQQQNVMMAFVKGKGTWAGELFGDGTIGIHDEYVKALVELPEDDPVAQHFPNGNEALILLRKSNAVKRSDWAKIPISMIGEKRKTSIIQLPGGSMGQQGGGPGGQPQDMGGGQPQEMGGGQPQEMGGGQPEGMGEAPGQGEGGWFNVPAGAIDQNQIQGGEQGGGAGGGNGWFKVPAGAIDQNMLQGGGQAGGMQMPGGQQ